MAAKYLIRERPPLHMFIVTCPPVLPEVLEIATVHEVASSSDLSTIWEWPGNKANHGVHV